MPKLTQMLRDQKIAGLMVGDERICHGDRMSQDDWKAMINAMRNSFPRGTAIIYTNECSGTFGDDKHDPVVSEIPGGLDWVSIDKYRTDTDDDFFSKEIQGRYNKYIFPKLQSYQKVAVTPQTAGPVGGPISAFHYVDRDDDERKLQQQQRYKGTSKLNVSGDDCDNSCSSKLELKDAQDFVNWAKSEPRIAMIAPYRWAEASPAFGLSQMSSDLQNFWHDFGINTKN